MTSLTRGQNMPLASAQLTANVAGVTPGTVDLMVFQVTSTGKVRSDSDFVFFNQPASPEGAVRLTGPSTVAIDLSKAPHGIDTLRLAVSMDDSAPGSLAGVPDLGVTIGPISAPALGLTTERAAVLAEIYRRGDQWKVRNVAAGWDSGLKALVEEHGVAVDDTPTQPPAYATQQTPAPAPQPRPQPAPPAPQPVRLQKVVLTKSTPTMSLAKSGQTGMMRINLNWTHGRRGIFGGGAVDLDLACLYQLKNGSKGVVQALGKSFGNLHHPPYIALDGDDRSGNNAGGENLHINLAHLSEFKRILIFAYIYEGAPNWSAADGVVTLYPPTGPEVEVRLDSPDNRARSCAIALLKNEKNELTVTREVRYIHGTQSEISKAYRWGMRWTAGSK
ncbi:TerD family protein [Prescottella agglutinans]|uniref:Tellurite resistance protein TerA n=1 Tax=Prescottella agglutinans TaxID=1644129 RepID=A0ABT6MJP3_9NOCA|nr:TerD family protein [Prescottella agglutinans]MDH6284135.1 tellurite resistance protein TerA [Prescottella agglutinans]